jgi:hypothetical protein
MLSVRQENCHFSSTFLNISYSVSSCIYSASLINFCSQEKEEGRNKLPNGIHTKQLMSQFRLPLLRLALASQNSALLLKLTLDSLVSIAWNTRERIRNLFHHFNKFLKKPRDVRFVQFIAVIKFLNSAFRKNN